MTARSIGKTLLLLASALLLFTTTDVLAQKPPGWMDVGKGSCAVWNASPRPGDSANWNGGCVAGHINGTGTLQWLQEGRPTDRYQGEIRDGMMDGRGTYLWADGDRYVGQFHANLRNGRGVMSFVNGDRYDGDYRDGRPNGQGTHRTSDGRFFTGTWTNGCFRQGTRWDTVAVTPKECGFQ
ncbi:MAG TPA: hypothetical protein VMI56_11775 [Reyranella sp.]|nr:hypothetical protein [Reyranella sp.]